VSNRDNTCIINNTMAEQWKNEATFRTMADDEVHVHIAPNWDVFIDHEEEPRPNLSGHAAVVLGGFVASLDVVMPISDIYRRSDKAYRFAVANKVARPLEEMEKPVTPRYFSKYVERIIRPVSTPFKTNILQLNASTLKKVFLACSNTYDDEFVRSVIEGAELSDDVSANTFFIRNMLTEYERKKATAEAIAIAKAVRAAEKAVREAAKLKPSPDSVIIKQNHESLFDADQDAINQEIIELNGPILTGDTLITDFSQDDTVETPAASEEIIIQTEGTDGQKTIQPAEAPAVPELIPRSAVIQRVGALVFEAEAGTTFTEAELKKDLKIRTSDSGSIRSALFALSNAGFLRITARETGTYYERLDKPNPTDKD
jgi:hypothetical protein